MGVMAEFMAVVISLYMIYFLKGHTHKILSLNRDSK